MIAIRTLGLSLLTLGLLVVGVSAPAQVKMPPQIKPGMPPGGVKPPADPGKGKNPLPPAGLPGMNPGIGVPPGVPGVPAGQSPEKKKDEIKWPKEVNGKDLETTVKDMRTHSDPAVREAAVRALPSFGPAGREAGADDLIEAMKRDTDWNVRLAAISVGPVEFMSWVEAADALTNTGLATICSFLSHEQLPVKLEALNAIASVGPFIRKINPQITGSVKSIAHAQSSWQLRRAATAVLGSIGQGMQVSDAPDKRVPPDTGAVDALLVILKSDNCAMVRREAVNSLITLGPVMASQLKKWRQDLEFVQRVEKDKSVRLWLHVLIIRNDPNGLKGNEAHLEAIAKVLKAPEPGGRIEACQALGMLGEDAVTKIDELIGIINKEIEPSVVIAAIFAVTNMQSRAAATVPILQNVKATHPNADVKAVASEAIDFLAGRIKKMQKKN